MAKFTTTQSFSDGDQVTSSTLNAIVTGLAADSDLADDTTLTVTASGTLKVGTITATNIGSSAVTTGKIAADAVTGAKIPDDAIDSEHYAAGSIDEEHIATGALTWANILSTEKAVQADMESETAGHFTPPDVLKYHPGVAKAYGNVSMVASTVTITGGYNVSSAVDTGTGRRITLSVTMANANYIVNATPVDETPTPLSIVVSNKTTTTFDINLAAEQADRSIDFSVFGQLA